MSRRTITAVVYAVLCCCSSMLFAQEPSAADLARRVRELEQTLQEMRNSNASPDLVELQRQIEILTREIESLKTRQSDAPAAADAPQFGLGAAASKVYRSQGGVTFGGYGEFLYQNLPGRNDAGARVATRDSADALRIILYTGYKFSDRVLFNSELEVEHANTEAGGVVEMEFAYIEWLARRDMGIRAGLLLIPFGIINEQHEPTTFFGSRRPLVERSIIPATWREMGAGVAGETGPVTWRAYVTTGLNAARFTAAGIRAGRGGGAQSLAEDFALTGRLDWEPIVGSQIGGALYTGNAGQGALVTGQKLDARVTMFEAHGLTQFRGVQLRALVSRGTIDEAARINALNRLAGANSVGETFGGWYAEAGYDLASLRGFGQRSITPFVRYEKFDTQRTVPTGFARNAAQDQTVATFGIQWKPIPQTVIKADYQNLDNEAGTGTNQWNVAVGYIF